MLFLIITVIVVVVVVVVVVVEAVVVVIVVVATKITITIIAADVTTVIDNQTHLFPKKYFLYLYGVDYELGFHQLSGMLLIFPSDQVKSLPLFIRRLTAGSVYAYAMTKAVEALKKHKDRLPECVTILQELLCQDVYLPHYRGKWYEELALILQVHFKNCEQVCTI